ncbi:hypothetical protein BP5796_06607 [Coleophoma crateriformis]|uniref:Dock180 protein n=1 Tax=Coleophoma crateriformis TaxID=565419 RepID=A0A3D8RPA5_9HELO|nr:hypothetical protein BP5796_06607 [Coleophoma crateriformis]
MPWHPLPRIAFAVATYPFQATSPADLPLELGDELYIIEQGGRDAQWFRGYLVAPPSLLAGLTSVKGQTLEARVFSGIFPRSCVQVREVLGESDEDDDSETERINGITRTSPDSPLSAGSHFSPKPLQIKKDYRADSKIGKRPKSSKTKSSQNGNLSVVSQRDPNGTKPPAPVPMLKIGDETPTSASEPLVDEIASCLREWHSTNLHEHLLSRQYSLLDKMAGLVQKLDLARRQFLHNVLTTHELQKLREKTVWHLVKGNKMFNGEVIVRDPAERGRVLTGDDSAVEITKLQSMMSLLDGRPTNPVERLSLHHLLIDVKAFVGASTEPTTLVFFLAIRNPGSEAVALSENYIIEVPPSGPLINLAKAGQMRTLFTDLSPADVGDVQGANCEIFLVVKVRTTQQITAGKPVSRGGLVSRDENMVTRAGEKPLSSSGSTKSGRRSLMWGQKGQRNAFSRNAPITTKLDSVNEWSEGRKDSQDGPPNTAGSKNHGEKNGGSVSRLVTKTVGIGALNLKPIIKSMDDVEHVMSVWSPSSRFDQEPHVQGDGWEEVIRDLVTSKSGHFERSRKAERLQVHLKAFDHPDAETLIKSTPTLLAGITRTHKMGFSGAPTKPRSDVYITIDEAFLPRHALLSRYGGSAVPLANSIGGSNLQLTLELRRANGERIENCIFSSSNGEAMSSWESTAAERGESWNQTVRLLIPPNDVFGCHLVMVLGDVPNKHFAICHIPLWDQQAFMRDGYHSLLLYRYDDTTSSPMPDAMGKGGYLNLAWSARGKDDVSKDAAVTGPTATLRLRTYLCSTKFSQDKVLLGLLKWKDQPAGEVPELLKRLVFVPEIEIVKLLNDVFDALFGILVEHSGQDDYEDLVFSGLVTVLGIVHDRRFNLGPLVDQYAESKFNYPFATPCLVRSFTRLLAKPSDPDTSRKLRATFKVVRHILKFITHARGQQKVKEAGIGITSTSPGFTRHLRTIFKALDGLMRNNAPILVGSQTLAVQHFHTWLPELTGLLTTEEILHIAIDFMDSCSEVKGKLILYKLVLIINYSRLDLFSHSEQKSALAANTVRWIAPHWGSTAEVTEQWREQVRLCCSILSTQVEHLGAEIPDFIPKIIDSYLAIQKTPRGPRKRLSLLFPISYPFPSKPISGEAVFDEALVELSAILSAISTLPAGMQLELADDEMATLLEDTLRVHLSILQCEAFPADWLSVHIFHHKSTMKTLEYLAGILLESFLPDPDDAESYNTELWKIFFTVLLKLVGSDALALETFPEQKRRAVWKIAGDVRETGAELMRRTWEAIGWDTSADERAVYSLVKMGGYQVQYVPALVGPIVELCLSVHEGLRRVAVEVLQTMIISEWTLSEDLSVIQTEMIDCLDRFFKSKPLTESILQKLFINELLTLFEPLSRQSDNSLYGALRDLVGTIDEFLDLLVAVHSKDLVGEASHMIHRLRLMEFLRDMQKEEIFIRYVHQLAQLQADTGNFTEAGLALRLHADLYEWDPMKIVQPLAEPEFPAQSQFDRKERVYFDMIKYFEDGEAWSSALAAYKELQKQYEENIFDFPKLARTQRAIATIYETIAKSDKLLPKYFRVVYKGMGFPPGLRDKEFIFQGLPDERTSAFTDRMQEQHPSAQLVSSGDIDDVEGQFLQISSITPHRDLEHQVFQRPKVPQVIKDYLLSAAPQLFSVTASRNTSGPVTEHHAEKIVYTAMDPFPTILQRSEVVAVDRVQLSTLQTALERVIRKTQEISAVEKRFMDGEEQMASLLTEALNISVNPNSETSISGYRELLQQHSDGDDLDEVEVSPLENALQVSLIDHAVMIKRCLAMFSKSSHPHLRSSYEELSQNFESTFAPELALITPPQPKDRTPTPTPTWGLSSPESQTTSPFPTAQTNEALATNESAVIDVPRQSRQDRGNRLSFLRRTQPEPVVVTNGHTTPQDSDSNRSRSRSKDPSHRLSIFGHMSSRLEEDVEVGGGKWANESPRRSSSSQRQESSPQKENAVGGVRKRLSMLKLGKKKSKASILVSSVTEED